MYGYQVHVPAPIDVYLAMHRAVLEVMSEDGEVEGLLVHYAYPSADGFDLVEVWESKEQLDAFNREVFPKAIERAGIPMGERQPEPVEFTPTVVMTPRVFSSDAG